jgi:2-succinyl-5-enolpyruvyl-6-hydroxy-3-cyclohexene-1-carboxylate synthase
MKVQYENINILWGSLIVEELIRNDINVFFLSPGSRSTPLTVAVARHPGAQKKVIYDERSAAFLALGYARGCGKPAVLICTSGTAIANYWPAVVEAASDYVPMIIISADRPAEKIETGANQTIRQNKFFGDYIRWSFDLPSPIEEIGPEMVLTTVDHLIHQSISDPKGPVHLNCHFREPLAPVSRKISGSYLKNLSRWSKTKQPYTYYAPSQKNISSDDMQHVMDRIIRTNKGLLVAGRIKTLAERQAVQKLSSHLNWPVFADILSGLRLGFEQQHLITNFDLILLADKLHRKMKPDLVVHIGEQPASKRYLQFIESVSPEEYILVTNHSYRTDPVHRVSWRLPVDIRSFCETVMQQPMPHSDGKWLNKFLCYSSAIKEILDKELSTLPRLSEPAVNRLVSQLIPESQAMFLSNSLPIREMDMFGDSTGKPVPIASNRGVSGIDGTLSTALGYSIAQNKPVTLLTGDLALIHDLNALSLIPSSPKPLIIVLINNGGGGIFSFLPIAQHPDVFETYFGTPHSFTFEYIAKQFGIDYEAPQTLPDLRRVYTSSLQKNNSILIEIKTDRQENHKNHLNLFQQIIAALEKLD